MGEPGIEPGYHLLPTAMPGDTFLARLCRFIALNNDATPLHNPARRCLALPLLRVTSHSHCLTLTMLRLTMLCFAVALQCRALPLLCRTAQCHAFAKHCRTLPLPDIAVLRGAFALFFLALPLPFLASACLAMALRLYASQSLSFAYLHKAMPLLCNP